MPTERQLQRNVEVEVDGLSIGPYRLLRFLRYYAHNAAARDELADERVFRRLESV